MKKILKTISLVSALALTQMTAMASPVIDQSNSGTANYGFCYAGIGQLCGQSFTQTNNNISGAGFYIHPNYFAGDGTVTISIYSNYGVSPSGLIASGTSSIVNSNTGWVDAFWSPAAVTTGTQYYMVIDSEQDYLVASYSDLASYAGGNALYGGDPTTYFEYDLAFRTYADNGATNELPEPTTLGLFGLGLMGLAFSRRR